MNLVITYDCRKLAVSTVVAVLRFVIADGLMRRKPAAVNGNTS